MGLTIAYGYLEMVREDEEGVEWFNANLARVNAVLVDAKLPAHVEPVELREHVYRFDLGTISWSWLHCLRRIQAYALQKIEITPAPTKVDGLETAIDKELTVYMRSHLIVHADNEGWYVPIDFKEIIFDDSLPGGMLGSSQRLIGELRSIADLIGIKLQDGELSDEEAIKINNTAESDPFFRERTAWLALFEAARLSIALKTAIVFH